MGDVVPFRRPEPDGPTLVGTARCAACQREWTAEVPAGVPWLECPGCGLLKGRLVHDALPAEDIWQCGCGCDVFRVTRTATFCIQCGLRQRF